MKWMDREVSVTRKVHESQISRPWKHLDKEFEGQSTGKLETMKLCQQSTTKSSKQSRQKHTF